MGLSYEDNQGAVVQAVIEEMKRFLHPQSGHDFIFNATNINKQMRDKYLTLMNDYHARHQIIYLESTKDWNSQRTVNRVPQTTIEKMRMKWDVPSLSDTYDISHLVDGVRQCLPTDIMLNHNFALNPPQ